MNLRLREFSLIFPPDPDPVLTSLAQDVFKVISQTPEALAPLQTRLVPTLVSIMESQAEKVSPGLQAVALGTSQGIWQNWLGKMVEHPNQSQPNPNIRAKAPPCIVFSIGSPKSHTFWGAACGKGFVICFLKVPIACLGGMTGVVYSPTTCGTLRKHLTKSPEQVAAPGSTVHI